MKLCRDKQCKRFGEELPFEEFPVHNSRDDRRYPYCSECARRRANDRYRRRVLSGVKVERAPVKDRAELVITKVREAVEQGEDTRERIKRFTRFSEDEVSDALADLWDRSVVRIVKVQEQKFFVRAA